MNDEPSIDQWLEDAKKDPNADKCGMYLIHKGVARSTAKSQVRAGENKPAVDHIEFSYDEDAVQQTIEKTKQMDGIYYVRTWFNYGKVNIGDPIMYVLVGGDIRPRVHAALNYLVDTIKSNYVDEHEVYVEK